MNAPRPRRKGKIGGDKSAIVAQIPAACNDERLAVEFLEEQRWGDTPCCPRCGDTDVRKMVDAKTGERSRRFLWRCSGCKRQYTVRINSVYEDSRIPLRHWVFAFWAACASKKGVSALQVKRQTGLNYRSALFLMNRIRFAMSNSPDSPRPLMSGVVETDEVYVGGAPRESAHKRAHWSTKAPVVAMVQRGGELRAWAVTKVTGEGLQRLFRENVAKGTVCVTDGNKKYECAIRGLGTHKVIKHHLREYVDPTDRATHTNTVEGFFSLFRKKLDGTHHWVSKKHLHRYADEAAFIYTNRGVDDGERTVRAIRGASGKRLTYAECVKESA
ncbi:MAG: IS1595 family transposase [Phycisphaerales bacterium]